MADRLLEKLIQKDIIEKEAAEIYRFGIEILSLKMMHYAVCLLIAVLLREVIGFMIFLIAFLPLRKNGGGYHARTKEACLAVSCLMTAGIALGIQWMPVFQGEDMIYALLITISGTIIYILAPLGNRNRELEEAEIKYFRHRTHIFLTITGIAGMITVLYGNREYAMPIVWAVTGEAVLLLFEKKRKKRNKNKKTYRLLTGLLAGVLLFCSVYEKNAGWMWC